MFNTSRHPPDEQILQFIDLELSANHTERLKKHLVTCPTCQNRKALMERRLQTLNELYDSQEIVSDSRIAGSRIQLREKLAKYRRSSSPHRVQAPLFHLRLSIVALTMLVLVGLTFYVGGRVRQSRSGILSSSQKMLIPNSSLTPGAVRPVTLSEICSATESDDLDPNVSISTEVAVLKEYGLPSDAAAARNYQIDYLVNPQLGGTDDIRNLWPQPYSNSAWNAHAKDVLEQHLHQMVCNRMVNLADAQRELAADWIAAYKKYLGRVGS
jgi:hypothetical protein